MGHGRVSKSPACQKLPTTAASLTRTAESERLQQGPPLSGYGLREATRSSHRQLAIRHLRLRAFVPSLDMETAIALSARAAFDNDGGRKIMTRPEDDMKASQFVLPPVPDAWRPKPSSTVWTER